MRLYFERVKNKSSRQPKSRQSRLWSFNFKMYSILAVLFISAVFTFGIALKMYQYRLNTKVSATKEYKRAVLKTNLGDIEILFYNLSPKATENFVRLAESGFYNGTKFHRAVGGLLVEGGDPLSKNDELKRKWGHGGPGYVFADEIHTNDLMVKGVVAMVNNGPNTNGSQFFILASDAPWLLGKHTLLALVANGFKVVEKISKVPVGVTGIPTEAVVLESVIIK